MSAQSKGNSKGSLHDRIRDRILGLVSAGGMRKGDPLPTCRELADRLEASFKTVQRAVSSLCDEGVLRTVQGKGVFVEKEFGHPKRTITQVGLVYSCSHQYFYSANYMQDIFRGLALEGSYHQTDIRIFSIRQRGPILPGELSDSGVDAVVLCSISNENYIKSFLRWEVPVVVIDQFNPKIPLDFVAVDNANSASLVLDSLLAKGHKNIAYLDGRSFDFATGEAVVNDSSDLLERRDAYRAGMKQAGLEKMSRVIDRLPQVIEEWTGKRDAGASRPTAIIAYDGTMAKELINELAKNKIKVPEDLSVAHLASAGPEVLDGRILTGIHVDFMEMGKRAYQTLEERCRKRRPREARRISLQGAFTEGHTVAQR